MKRGRSGDVLTGGSGDVNPQWFTLPPATTSAANTFTEIQTPLPVQRFNQKSGKSLVMEILQAHVFLGEWDANPAALGSSASIVYQLGTIAQLAVSNSLPQNILGVGRNWRGAFTAGGSYEAASDNPIQVDLTDGAGHGLLVATDAIFQDVNTLGFAGAATVQARLLYRWKEITLQEYIGIVQSQQ